MEKDILIINTQFHNQSPGGEPFQLAGANGLRAMHLTINGLEQACQGAGDATTKRPTNGKRKLWAFI